MAEFVRGLSDTFVQALNREYDRGGWWKRMVEDPDLYLGIRDQSLNLYYKGNSLLQLEFKGGHLIAKVHYKYLLKPTASLAYVTFEDGHRKGELGEGHFLACLEVSALLKGASKPYAGEEKQGVHDILRSNKNIVDVEIALVGAREESENKSAKRIDFAALQERDGGPELVFFEAKRFVNPELRASGTAIPSVVRQIQSYEQLITDHRTEIKAAYRRVCENLSYLSGIHRELRAITEKVAEGASFSVNPLPRLVVFGFDDDQRIGDYWGKHRMKLMALGKDRILTRGNPKGFRKGISLGI